MSDGEIVLEAAGIVKSFPGVRALRGVGLTVKAGRLNALLGENGAGKSTLMNILAGVFPPPERFTKLYAPKNADGSPTKAREARMVPTGIRKLYLPTHKRFYLVVSELH